MLLSLVRAPRIAVYLTKGNLKKVLLNIKTNHIFFDYPVLNFITLFLGFAIGWSNGIDTCTYAQIYK